VNILSETLGADYISLAFHLAREADPGAELFLNEAPGLADSSTKAQVFYELARSLVEAGVPVDGVGIQGHFVRHRPDMGALRGYVQSFAELGLRVEVTELDMPVSLYAGAEDPLGAQAEAYYQIASLCAEVPAFQGVTLWGIHDGATWLDHIPPFSRMAPNQPLLFTAELEPKPAYYAFLAGLSI
jgi:endo-1,4-beta-xylanase